jgi:tetratricopeptide (TPR) repeat protein
MPYLYVVEKKIKLRAIIISLIVFVIVSVLGIFWALNYIQKRRLSSVYDYISLSDYDNASFIFTKLYNQNPLNGVILKTGVDLYYDILIRGDDLSMLQAASENVVMFTKQLFMINSFTSKKWLFYQRLGYSYSILGKPYYHDAYNAYIKAIEEGDKRSTTVINLAKICYNIGYFEDAVFYLEHSVLEASNDGESFNINLRYELANAYEGNKEYSKAIELLSNLENLRIDDTVLSYNIYSKLGGLYLRQGLFKESEFFYKKAQVLNAKSPDIYYSIGFLYQKMNKRKEAISMYREALKFDRNHKLANEALRRL